MYLSLSWMSICSAVLCDWDERWMHLDRSSYIIIVIWHFTLCLRSSRYTNLILHSKTFKGKQDLTCPLAYPKSQHMEAKVEKRKYNGQNMQEILGPHCLLMSFQMMLFFSSSNLQKEKKKKDWDIIVQED